MNVVIGNSLAAGLLGLFSGLLFYFIFKIFDKKKAETALIKKIKNNDIQSCVQLLNEGVNIDEQDDKGATALIYAVLSTNPKLVKLLVDRNANTNIYTRKGVCAKLIAINNNLTEIIQILNSKK